MAQLPLEEAKTYQRFLISSKGAEQHRKDQLPSEDAKKNHRRLPLMGSVAKWIGAPTYENMAPINPPPAELLNARHVPTDLNIFIEHEWNQVFAACEDVESTVPDKSPRVAA